MLVLQGEEWIQCFGEGVDGLHFHNHLEIGYCYYGEGKMLIGSEEFPFEEGTCTLIPKNIPHATKSIPGTISRWEYVFVDVEGVIPMVFPTKSMKWARLQKLMNKSAYVFAPGEGEAIRSLIWKILKEMEEQPAFYKEQSVSYLHSLVVQIMRKEIRMEEKIEDEEDIQQIAQALNQISRCYNQPLRIKDLAESCYLSESHFRRIFGNCMGMTPTDYMNLIRVQVACEMLNKTNDSILEIAQKVGYGSPSTLNRNFRKVMGTSPSQWRNSPENYEYKILNWEIIQKNNRRAGKNL